MRAAAIVLCSALAGACAGHPSPDDCTKARDHLIDVRFAANAHDPDKLWQLLVESGGDGNVDRRALKAALARAHDDHWLEPLRDRQRFSPQMRTWVKICASDFSKDDAACIVAAQTEAQALACAVPEPSRP